MKTYQLYNKPKVLIFDMDNTLYSNHAYTKHQEEVLVQRLAIEKKWNFEQAQTYVDSWRREYSHNNGGKKPSLGNTFVGLGVSIQTSIRWRDEFIRPDEFLKNDEFLLATLMRLQHDFILTVVTNNPLQTAARTLSILGVGHLFQFVVGLDSTNASKPDPAAFKQILGKCECLASDCLSIGDRYEVDIEPALHLGMAGILVDGVADVYELPETLCALP